MVNLAPKFHAAVHRNLFREAINDKNNGRRRRPNKKKPEAQVQDLNLQILDLKNLKMDKTKQQIDAQPTQDS